MKKMKKKFCFSMSFDFSFWFTGGSVQHFEIIKKPSDYLSESVLFLLTSVQSILCACLKT